MISNKNSGVSVIVCCYNSVPRLPNTLSALAKQQINIPVEIILIDNASTDQTRQAAEDLWATLGRPFPLSIYTQPIPGLMNARAMGIQKAQYPITVFCDDDNWLEQNYLSIATDYLLKHPQVGAVGGEGRVTSDTAIPPWFKEVSFYFACFPQINPKVLYGAGIAVRTHILQHIQTIEFKTQLTGRSQNLLLGGDDHELSYLIRWSGFELAYVPELLFQHYMPPGRLNLDYLFRLGKGSGYSEPLLWPYETQGNVHVYAVYKFTRLLAGFPKIVAKYFTQPELMKIRLKLLFAIFTHAIKSYVLQWQKLSQIQIVNKSVRKQLKRENTP
jgi:glycosyltransferase involved in cell wall biosynthesis